MLRFVFSPQWFYGIDTVFEFLALGITALISLYCYVCYYRVCENKSYKYFSYSFFSLVAAFFFKILANVTIVYEKMEEQQVGTLLLTITSIKQSQLLFFIGTALHHFFFLLGLIILFLIIQKEYNKSTIALLVFFTLITTLFSSSAYFVFYLTSSVILGLIFLRYWKNFKAKRTKKALLLALSFLTILVSHVIFIFVFVNLQLYAVAETVQLFGFILLLLTFMSLLRKNESTN